MSTYQPRRNLYSPVDARKYRPSSSSPIPPLLSSILPFHLKKLDMLAFHLSLKSTAGPVRGLKSIRLPSRFIVLNDDSRSIASKSRRASSYIFSSLILAVALRPFPLYNFHSNTCPNYRWFVTPRVSFRCESS